MGYVMATSGCLFCHRNFSYNPVWVPSFRVNGVKEPICEGCMVIVNEKRVEAGVPPFEIHPEAYEPCDEAELGE